MTSVKHRGPRECRVQSHSSKLASSSPVAAGAVHSVFVVTVETEQLLAVLVHTERHGHHGKGFQIRQRHTAKQATTHATLLVDVNPRVPPVAEKRKHVVRTTVGSNLSSGAGRNNVPPPPSHLYRFYSPICHYIDSSEQYEY